MFLRKNNNNNNNNNKKSPHIRRNIHQQEINKHETTTKSFYPHLTHLDLPQTLKTLTKINSFTDMGKKCDFGQICD